MNRKFSILIGLVIVGLFAYTCYTIFPVRKMQSDDASQTVQRFFELSERGDYKEIKKYTTYTPQAYFVAQDKWLELYRKSQGITPVKKTFEEKTDNLPRGRHVPTESEKQPGVVISERVPEEINKFKLHISEIENVWINGNESRVRVIIKSKDLETYRVERDY